ncbi:MAG: MFS transporter [Candidatus Sulfotelmatobacter sp.]|jgi:fucose permease
MDHVEIASSSIASSTSNRATLICSVYACMFVFGVVVFLMGALLPSLHVTYAQAGSLGSVPLLGILVATTLVGPILDTAGVKNVIVVALILIAASLATMPSLHIYWQLVIGAATYGFGGGLLNTATNVMISELSAGNRASALNRLGFFFSLGAISAPLMMSTVGGSLSPAVVLRLLATATTMVLVPVLILRFPPPVKAGQSIWNTLHVLRQPAVWLFGMLLFFESGNENCMFVWSSKIVADVIHTTATRANLALVGLSISLGLGRLLATLWLRRLGNLGTIWLSTAVILIGSLLTSVSSGLAAMIVGLTVIGLGLSAVFPTTLALAGDCFPGQTGTVFGTIMTLALMGGTCGPALASFVVVHGPLKVLWIPAISAIAVALLAGSVGMHKRRAGI